MFQCEKCGNTFSSRFNLERHLNRKTPCDPIIEKKKELDFSCIYCNREFSRKQNLRRHLNSCPIYNGGNIKKDLIAKFVSERDKQWKKKYKELEKRKNERIDELERRLVQIMGKSEVNINNTQTTINDSSHHNDNSINIHFHGVSPLVFNSPNMRKLQNKIMNSTGIKAIQAKNAKNDISRSLKTNQLRSLIRSVMKLMHDNKDFPEGMNIFRATIDGRENVFVTLQQEGWAITLPDDVADVVQFEIESILYNHVKHDPEHKKTKQCMEQLKDVDQIEAEITGDVGKTFDDFEMAKSYEKKPFKLTGPPEDCSSDVSSCSSYSTESESE